MRSTYPNKHICGNRKIWTKICQLKLRFRKYETSSKISISLKINEHSNKRRVIQRKYEQKDILASKWKMITKKTNNKDSGTAAEEKLIKFPNNNNKKYCRWVICYSPLWSPSSPSLKRTYLGCTCMCRSCTCVCVCVFIIPVSPPPPSTWMY